MLNGGRHRIEITKDRLLLVEGPHDAAFFRELINKLHLPPANVFSSSDLSKKCGKTGLRSFVASVNEKQPDIGLGRIWENAPSIIPINDHAFNQIAKFLKNF